MTLTVELKVDKTASYIYAGRVTGGLLNGKNHPIPQPENWTNESFWILGTNYWATNVTANTWTTCFSTTDYKRGDRIPLGFDDNAVSGHTSVQMRIKIDGVVKYTVTFDNMLHDFSYYRIKSYDIKAQPIYLERLSQLANNSRAVTRNSKSL